MHNLIGSIIVLNLDVFHNHDLSKVQPAVITDISIEKGTGIIVLHIRHSIMDGLDTVRFSKDELNKLIENKTFTNNIYGKIVLINSELSKILYKE